VNSSSQHERPQAPFCVTLLDFSRAQTGDFNEALRQAGHSLPIVVRFGKNLSDESYPAAWIHAIVLTPRAIAQVTGKEVDTIQSAANRGTCRVYLLEEAELPSTPTGGLLDAFIQRTQTHGCKEVAKEIVFFFREADSLNRRSTPRAFRDMMCLAAYRTLAYVWPVSYVFAVAHLLNATTVLAGRGAWLDRLAGGSFIPASSFFGAFFIVHCILGVVRNGLFAVRIAKGVISAFARGAAGFGLAAAATAYSIAVTDVSISRIFGSAILAVAAYACHLYARRIRAECTSLSQIQAAMTDSQRREEVLKRIGERRLGHSAFPLFPFRNRALFISYMHGSPWSSGAAALVQQWASRHGFEVFLDRSTIPSGSLWRQSLLRAISECGFFVAVIDGDAPITDWVLAESAYAAQLRKSIGKPRILLVVRHVKRIVEDEKSPLRRLYLDVLHLSPPCCPGAATLPVDDDRQLTEERFLHALEAVPPMSLLLGGGTSMRPEACAETQSMQSDASQSDALQLMDRSWRTSVLLGMLLESAGGSVEALELLRNKSFAWIRSNSAEKKTVGLNTLRFLFKGNPFFCRKALSNEILDLFVSEASLAVRLAALDFLGSVGTTPNPLTLISSVEAMRITEFRDGLMKKMHAEQQAYAAQGVRVDLARESSGKTHEEALRRVIARVDSVDDE